MEARSRGGHWLVRIEDLDPRCIEGCAAQQLRTLEAFGFTWDGPVEYQSRRTEHYQAALERLQGAGLAYECSCSRRELSSEGGSLGHYPGTCRSGARHGGATATRLRIEESFSASLEDAFQGRVDYAPGTLGDVIIRRRDGIIAYQLAVVVDDALQGITDVVRGADLLESTGWQIALQRALGLPTPRYGHLPLLTEPDGTKLAKRHRAAAIEAHHASEQLHQVLALLGQNPPQTLQGAAPATILAWAIEHWRAHALRGLREIALPSPPTPAPA